MKYIWSFNTHAEVSVRKTAKTFWHIKGCLWKWIINNQPYIFFVCDFVFRGNCPFKRLSCQILLLASLHKTTQLSVNHEGKNHNALSGRQSVSKTDKWGIIRWRTVNNFIPGIIKWQNHCKICFCVLKDFFPLDIVQHWLLRVDLRGHLLNISVLFARMKKGNWGSLQGT